MGLLITQILEVFNDFNKTLCPGFYKEYLRARKKSQPADLGAGVQTVSESTDYNFYLTEQQKMSAKYCAESLYRLSGMPKVSSKCKLGQFTDQYLKGVITDWEYIERVVEAAEGALESANQQLYKEI